MQEIRMPAADIAARSRPSGTGQTNWKNKKISAATIMPTNFLVSNFGAEAILSLILSPFNGRASRTPLLPVPPVFNLLYKGHMWRRPIAMSPVEIGEDEGGTPRCRCSFLPIRQTGWGGPLPARQRPNRLSKTRPKRLRPSYPSRQA